MHEILSHGCKQQFKIGSMMMHQFQDGGRSPSWISILGDNFGVD